MFLIRRTFDESGNYTVKYFIDTRESINNTVKGVDFTGVYSSDLATTDDGGTVMIVYLFIILFCW